MLWLIVVVTCVLPQYTLAYMLIPSNITGIIVGITDLNRTTSGWPLKFDHPIQSPVDLIISKAKTLDLPMLTIDQNKQPGVKARVYNAGYTVKIFIKEEDPSLKPYLTGGPLKDKFIFEQMHFHWGSEDIWGSEHFVDGESYAFEIHTVHFNRKYGTFENAANKKDGLSVLTVLVKVQDEDNKDLQPLYDLLPKIREFNSSQVFDSVKVMQWATSALKINKEYYTYPESLTTIPYTENVTWILLLKPISMSAKQLRAFREIRNKDGKKVLDNKRQLQPIHSRTIFRSTRLQYL